MAIGRARYNEGDKDSLFSKVQECYQHSMSIRNSKSAAIDLVRVASGENVAYIERYLQPYDYAAASVIIEEAGGIIMQTNGAPITIGYACSILAGTPKAIEQIQNPNAKKKKRRRRQKKIQDAAPKQKAPSE